MKAKPSKSARKRQNLALQALGEQLIELPPETLAELPLEERLREAVIAARGMKAHGALRRQKQLIGKLMREQDPTPIEALLARRRQADYRERRVFHEAETWRDRVTGDNGDALAELFAYLGDDAAEIIEAVKAFRRARNDRDRKAARRSVFRAIHQEIARKMHRSGASI